VSREQEPKEKQSKNVTAIEIVVRFKVVKYKTRAEPKKKTRKK